MGEYIYFYFSFSWRSGAFGLVRNSEFGEIWGGGSDVEAARAETSFVFLRDVLFAHHLLLRIRSGSPHLLMLPMKNKQPISSLKILLIWLLLVGTITPIASDSSSKAQESKAEGSHKRPPIHQIKTPIKPHSHPSINVYTSNPAQRSNEYNSNTLQNQRERTDALLKTSPQKLQTMQAANQHDQEYHSYKNKKTAI